jgi:DNA polymerase III subunit alpha
VDKVMEIHEGERAPRYFGKEVSIGGIVTSAMERMSKNGSPFMIFKIEDYRGSMEMLLGGEDYIRFKNYLQVGQFLYIKGKVQTRWKQDDNFEFKISAIQLLPEIREKMCKKIRINLTLDQIDAQFIHLLKDTFAHHPGSCTVNMTVTDPETHVEVEMLSRGYRVAPTNELFKMLNGFHGVKFFLN